mmetsp:Transcript_15013/g.35764  ORF Transcript_15013/g.35764 Transcript_15013/m.35764 type:complete len:246 (-) Transcript_15013:1443-2180(-)
MPGAWHQNEGEDMQVPSADGPEAQDGAPLNCITQPPLVGRPGPRRNATLSAAAPSSAPRSTSRSCSSACLGPPSGAAAARLAHQLSVKAEMPAVLSSWKASERPAAAPVGLPPQAGSAQGAVCRAPASKKTSPLCPVASAWRHSERSAAAAQGTSALGPVRLAGGPSLPGALCAASNAIVPERRISVLRSWVLSFTASCVSSCAAICRLLTALSPASGGFLIPAASSCSDWPTSSTSWNSRVLIE